MRTTIETRAKVYDLDRAAKARFTEPTDRVLGHQPRERAVGCTRCGASTFEPHAVCATCGPQTCERCLPWGGAA